MRVKITDIIVSFGVSRSCLEASCVNRSHIYQNQSHAERRHLFDSRINRREQVILMTGSNNSHLLASEDCAELVVFVLTMH